MVEAKSGLMGSVRRLSLSLLTLVGTRIALLANELQEERVRLTQMFLYALIALFCFGLGILLLTILVVVLFWDEHRVAVLAVSSVMFFVCGGLMLVLARNNARLGSKLFAASLAELDKDKQQLRGQHE